LRAKLESAKNLLFIALAIDMAVTALVVITDFWAVAVFNDIRAGVTQADQSTIRSLEFWDAKRTKEQTQWTTFAKRSSVIPKQSPPLSISLRSNVGVHSGRNGKSTAMVAIAAGNQNPPTA